MPSGWNILNMREKARTYAGEERGMEYLILRVYTIDSVEIISCELFDKLT